MKKIRIGVLGGYRGTSLISFFKESSDAVITAICDKNDDVLDQQKEFCKGLDVKFYHNYDEMIESDIDAVVLANYANEHAPFAIKALKKGLHVYSEVLPAQNLSEAIKLIETVEETKLIYAYGENYCYMPAPREIKKLYEEGVLGEFEYGEGEYVHNCEPIWHAITYGDKDHWRNNMYSSFYCTHSIGPLIHITKLRPIKVVAFEGTKNERNLRSGAKGGQFAVEMITLENGGIIKSVHGGLYENSVWYSLYGSKGRAESAREDTGSSVDKLYLRYDDFSGQYENKNFKVYSPEVDEKAKLYAHGGSDYYSVLNFVKKIKGDKDADTIDVYEALDMFLPGLMGYISILHGSIPVDIPNLRDKEVRDKYRNNTACTDKKVALDMLLPTFSKGTPNISDEVYLKMKSKYEKALYEGNDGYINGAFHRNTSKKKK